MSRRESVDQMDFKYKKDRRLSEVFEKMILLIMIMALCGACAHFLLENHELRNQIQEIKAEEDNEEVLRAENRMLKEKQEALEYSDERIVQEYASKILPAIYGDDDTSSYLMLEKVKTNISDDLYEDLTGDLMMDAGEDWDKAYSDGITVTVEVSGSYTQRVDESHIRVFSRCRQEVRTEGGAPAESTLYVGSVFMYEDGVWKLSEITFEENLPGFYEKVY